jgi:hypothetical protein
MGRGRDGFEEAGFLEAELESAEFGGEKGDDFEGFRWREDDGVDAVDYAVGSKLLLWLDWVKREMGKQEGGRTMLTAIILL